MRRGVLGSLLGSIAACVVLTGCAAERPEAVPSSASLVAKQTGDVSFTAPDDGEIYIYDQTANEMVYSGSLRKGEVVMIKPQDDEVSVNGRAVSEKKLRDLNEIRVFFDEVEASAPAGTVIERKTTVIQEEKN